MTGQNYKVAHNAPLLEYLFEIFPGQSRTGVKNLLSKGQVLVNGEGQTAFDWPLKTGDKLTILPKGISIARATRSDARDAVIKAGVQILFEDENYIVVDKDGSLSLTETGMVIAEKIFERHQVLTEILMALGVDRATATADACKMEHDISDTTFDAMKRHLKKKQPGNE